MFKAIINFFKPYPAKVEEKPQSVVEAAPAPAPVEATPPPVVQEEAKVVIVPDAVAPAGMPAVAVTPAGGWPFPDAPPAEAAPVKKPRKPRAPKKK